MKKVKIILSILWLFILFETTLAVPPVDIQIGVKGTAPSTAGPLTLNRVELVFDNGRGDITVPLSGRVKVKAFINYTGNGVLNANWIVDGRVIQQVNQSLTYGTDIVIETQEVPPLPTFEPGKHTVTLQIISPLVNFTIPTISYFVAEIPIQPGKIGIKLYSPENGIFLYKDELAFSWDDPAKAGLYQLLIWEGKRNVFNALTKDFSYKPSSILQEQLFEGNDYTWEIVAIDKTGREAGKSETRGFHIRTEPGEVIFRDFEIKKAEPTEKLKGVIPSKERFQGSRKISVSKEVMKGDEITIVGVIENWKRNTVSQVLVQFKVNGEIISKQVIPELPSGEFTSLEAAWTIPAGGNYNITVETLLQGNVKDTAMAILNAGDLPLYTGLDFLGRAGGGLYSSLDFTGKLAGGLYSSLDFTGKLAGGIYSNLDFSGKLTGGIYPKLDFTGKLAGGVYSGLDFTGKLAGGVYNGLDFTGKLTGGIYHGLDFKGRLVGKVYNDLDFTGKLSGKIYSGLDFTGKLTGEVYSGLDFRRKLAGEVYNGLDFTGKLTLFALGKNDVTDVNFLAYVLGKNDITEIDFQASPLGKNDVTGIDFSAYALGKNDVSGIDFLAHPLGKNDVTNVGFNAYPLSKNDVTGINFSAHALGKNDVTGVDFTATSKQNWITGPTRMLTEGEKTLARNVFGDSLDFDRIRISSMIGLSDRPWTSAAIPHPMSTVVKLGDIGGNNLDSPADIPIILLNLGEQAYSNGVNQHTRLDLTPDNPNDRVESWADELFIHELTHAWQSQHGQSGIEYVTNSVLSQALRPANANCAYVYTPGKPFREYGAEQIASIVEDYHIIQQGGTSIQIDTDGDGNDNTSVTQADLQPIIDVIRTAPKNQLVTENLDSLSTAKQGCPQLKIPIINVPF